MRNRWGNSDRLYFLGHPLWVVTEAMKLRCMLLGRKVMINLDSIFKSRDSKVVRQGAVGLQPPFLPPPVSGSFVERPTALCWDRASGGSQPQWFVGATMRRVQGRIYHFQWKTSGDY